MQQWEYEVVEITPGGASFAAKGTISGVQLHQAMNDMGRQGWELVSAFPQNLGGYKIVLLFKRPLQEQP